MQAGKENSKSNLKLGYGQKASTCLFDLRTNNLEPQTLYQLFHFMFFKNIHFYSLTYIPRPYQYVLSVQTAYLVRWNERISEELPTPNSQAVPSVCLSVCLFVNLSIFHPASFLSAISVCFISVLSCICTHIYLLSIVNPSFYHGLSSYPCLAISLSHSFRLSGNSRSLTQ